MRRFARRLAVCGLPLAVACWIVGSAARADETKRVEDGEAEVADTKPAPVPEKYTLDYPRAERFSPPLRGFFVYASRSYDPEKRVRHKLNGGYGLPVTTKVNGNNLLHLGADVGWRRVGEPVLAIAAGVVRQSHGPAPPDKSKATGKKDAAAKSDTSQWAWGNFIAIEHRLADDKYITSLYGHLDSDRLVQVGDIVEPGQPIGAIGRNHPSINGGYDPHLHFGIRDGRLAEPGTVILTTNGGKEAVELIAVTEDETVVKFPATVLGNIRLTIRNSGERHQVEFIHKDGRWIAPASFLWRVPSRPGFDLVGYGLTTDGWQHPVRFLQERRAAWQPQR